MGVDVCAQTVLYDLVKDMVEWHDATVEMPADDLCKLVEANGYSSYHLAWHKKEDVNRWSTGDCGYVISVKRWAVCPKEYWQRYHNGEFSTYEAWHEYVERLEKREKGIA